MLNRKTSFLIVFAAIIASFDIGYADEGQPIAIRHWPGGAFTVETMWDLHVGVGLGEEAKKMLPRPVDAELENLPGLKGDSCSLYRDANQSDIQLKDHYDHKSPNTVSLCISKNYETKEHFDARPLSADTDVYADGLAIGFLDHDRIEMKRRMQKLETELKQQKEHEGEEREGDHVRNGHVVVATGEQFTADFCELYAKARKPMLMIVNSSSEKVGQSKVEAIAHNTLAVSKGKAQPKKTRFVSLSTEPYKMSEELADLFEKKEVSQKATRELFASLSRDQMNFKPANGTHTPRWNAEHMMGRELGFFSEIYNAVDPSIPVMDLNPKQMPKDYQFAHEDWSGQEEALQIERVQNFTRRFAYLLDGMNLNKKAKGSRFWSPRALLRQMERHYKEHSANVRKKMKLEDWPKSSSQSDE